MKTMKKSILGAAVAAALGFGSAAQAGVLIDLFTDTPAVPGQRVVSSTNNVSDFNQYTGTVVPATIIGNYRDMSITKLSEDGGDNGASATMRAFNGFLSLNNDDRVKSVGVVTWDGVNDAGANGANVKFDGLGGVDLTLGGADRFLADVLSADLGFSYKIRIWDMDGDLSTLSAGVQFAIPFGGGTTNDFLFNWFNLATGSYCDGALSGPQPGGPPVCADPVNDLAFTIERAGGAIDFTKIGALQLEFYNPTVSSVDFSIGSVRANEVPEPGSLALGGIALLGAAFSLRRRRTGQA